MEVLLYNYQKYTLHRTNPTRSNIHQRILEGYIIVSGIKLYGYAIRVIGNPRNLRSFIIDDSVKRKTMRKDSKYANITEELDISMAFSATHVATIYGGN